MFICTESILLSWNRFQPKAKCYSFITRFMPMCLTTRKNWLVAQRRIWADTTPVDQSAQWEEDWSSAAVVNSHLVCHPTIQQPGFDLLHHSWTLLNGQGPCRANMHKWGLASSPLCDCGEQQTMEHIVDSCPLTNWMAACWASMKQTRMLSAGWRWRRRRHSRNEWTRFVAARRRKLLWHWQDLLQCLLLVICPQQEVEPR